MPWEFVVALVITIPIILLSAVFIWYLNTGGIYHVIRELSQKRKAVFR